MLENFPVREGKPFNITSIHEIKEGDIVYDIKGQPQEVLKVGRRWITFKCHYMTRVDLKTALQEPSNWGHAANNPIFPTYEDWDNWSRNRAYVQKIRMGIGKKIESHWNMTVNQAMALELAINAILGERI